MLFSNGTANVIVALYTSLPPSFSVIHYPDVQNYAGSFDINLLNASLTKVFVSESWVVGAFNQFYNKNAAPSVIASGQPYRPDTG